MSWFSELSKAQQAEYIKKHPNSKYAKGSTETKASSTKSTTAKKGRPRKTEQEKRITYMNRMLRRENKYYNARQVPYDPNR